MKKIGILLLGLGVLANVGCGRPKRVAEPESDGVIISETGQVSEVEEEPKKERRFLRGKKREKEQEAAVADVGEDEAGGRGEAEAEKPAGKAKSGNDSLSRAAEALAAAKLHIELGDYDLAGDELRKIGEGSALYEQAQRLLEAYR